MGSVQLSAMLTVAIFTSVIVFANGTVPFRHVKGVYSCRRAEGPSMYWLSIIVTLARPAEYCNMSRPPRFSSSSFSSIRMMTGGQMSPIRSVRLVNPVFTLHTNMYGIRHLYKHSLSHSTYVHKP